LEIDANAFMLQVAHNYGVNYFDGWTPFHSYAEFSARGLIGADGTHFTTAGGKAYGYYLTQFLQLYYTPGRFP
jgi:hypothetical protein